MPNVKRRFADDDPSSDDDDEEEEEEPEYYRGGGKGIRMPGGKGMGKQLRAPAAADSSDDDDDDDEEEEEEPTRVAHRGGGKQLRPGGKQLRAPPQQDDDDDDSDDDDEEEEAPVQPVQRGGGKALMRMRPPEDEDASDDDDEEIEDDAPPTRVVQRTGGKSLMRMQAPDDDEDDDDEEEEDEPVRPVPTGGGKTLRTGGGKQLRAPAAHDEDDDDDDDDDDEEEPVRPAAIGGGKTLRAPAPRGGGKQLRAPAHEDDDDVDDDDEQPIRPAPGGGKTLRAPRGGKQLRAPVQQEDDDDEEEEDDAEEEVEKPKAPQVVQRGGGKSLMRMAAPEEPDEEDSDEESVTEEKKPAPAPKAQPVQRGGKQLRPPQAPGPEEEKKEPPKPKPQPPVRGGKQLHRPAKDESEDDDDDDDMALDSEEEEKKKPPPKPAPKKKQAPKPDSDDMEESSDEESSDEEAELDMETFDTQRLVKNEEDQKYLDSLPEIEREAILAERFEKRKAEMDMKKALRETKRKEREEKAATKQKDTKKRKAAAPAKKPAAKKAKESKDDDADETLAKSLAGKRESGRNKDASGNKAQKAKALAALREERKKATRKEDSESESDFDDDDEDSDEDYGEKPWQKQAPETRRTSSRLDKVAASDDDEDDAIKNEDEEAVAPEAGRTVVEADLEDYQKITLPRRRLGRWCNEPYFKEAVMNCFVKLFIGENERGKRCYRLCKIVDVSSTPKQYELPPVKNQKPVKTDKMLKLKFAGNSRDFPISLVSDAKVDESDVKQYVDATKAIRQRTLGKKEANRMRRQQDKLVNDYVYTTEDIENNLRNRKKKGETAANLALERTRAAIAVQGARAALEDAKFQLASARDAAETQEFKLAVEAAEKVLEEKLEEERIVKQRAKDRKEQLTGRSKDQKWAKVNKRALEMNQKVDRGEMAEKKETADSSTKKESFNPYARRKVKPKILWEVGQKDEEDKGDVPKENDASKDKASEQENGDKELDSTPSLVQEQQHKAAALSQSHQFAIDEEVLAQSSFTNGIAGLGAKKSFGNRVRKGLSLEEYQKRKAAGTL